MTCRMTVSDGKNNHDGIFRHKLHIYRVETTGTRMYLHLEMQIALKPIPRTKCNDIFLFFSAMLATHLSSMVVNHELDHSAVFKLTRYVTKEVNGKRYSVRRSHYYNVVMTVELLITTVIVPGSLSF